LEKYQSALVGKSGTHREICLGLIVKGRKETCYFDILQKKFKSAKP
jgi:hypothetical protein